MRNKILSAIRLAFQRAFQRAYFPREEEEMNNEFCFCQLDFKAELEYCRNGVIRIREASLFDYACIAIKIPIK